VMTAAVADWRPETVANSKLKKTGDGVSPLSLVENPDILAGIAKHAQRPRLLIGFAAETENVLAFASEKRRRKGCDWILANDVGGQVSGGVFGTDRNTVHLITAEDTESWPELSKDAVAARLVERIIKALEKAA